MNTVCVFVPPAACLVSVRCICVCICYCACLFVVPAFFLCELPSNFTFFWRVYGFFVFLYVVWWVHICYGWTGHRWDRRKDKPHFGSAHIAFVAIMPVVADVLQLPTWSFKPGSKQWITKTTKTDRYVLSYDDYLCCCINATYQVALMLLLKLL